VRFERRARLACACSRSSGSAGRTREAHQPQKPRAALQASTRAAPVPGSTRKASQAPWGPLGGHQERASVAQRVLGVKVRQNGFSGPMVYNAKFTTHTHRTSTQHTHKKHRPKSINHFGLTP